MAVIATTMTIVFVFVFLSVSFIGGVVAQFFREFGLTVGIAVLLSLLVARLLTPLLAAYFLKPTSDPHPRKPFTGWYRRLLEWALANRWKSLGIGTAIFFFSLFMATLLPTGFTPASNYGIVQVSIEGAPGATLADMRQSSERLTRELRQQDDVELVFTSVGAGEMHDRERQPSFLTRTGR